MFDLASKYPRDLVGYGRNAPHPRWPNDARLALQIILAYEPGGEHCVLHGDACSESALTDVFDPPPVMGGRHLYVESSFEYGARVGMWRLLRLMADRDLQGTVFAVAAALSRCPELAKAFIEDGHEVMSHGYRWVNYQYVAEEVEREHIRLAVEAIRNATGVRPVGWMTGRPGPNTRRLVVEEGGFLYDQDSCADELPYWVKVGSKPHLIIPMSFDTNDNGFSMNIRFGTGEQFFTYLREAFDHLYKEGATSPRLMTVAVHERICGRPARASGFEKFLDYVARFQDVWVCRGTDIANHWRKTFPPRE